MPQNVQINGSKGYYDNKVKDSSVKYGRNAVDNHMTYLETPLINDNKVTAPILDFSYSQEAQDKNFEKIEKFLDKNDVYLNALPPLEYEYRYMPHAEDCKVDTNALLGAAYEQMGAKELSVEDFEYRYMDDTMTAKPLDINKDGKIDVAEYGANILATDLLSKGTTDVSKIDGTINSKGMNAILAYSQKANASAAAKLYGELYNEYSLGRSISEFNPS